MNKLIDPFAVMSRDDMRVLVNPSVVRMHTEYGIDVSWRMPDNAPIEYIEKFKADVRLSDGDYQVVLTVNS